MFFERHLKVILVRICSQVQDLKILTIFDSRFLQIFQILLFFRYLPFLKLFNGSLISFFFFSFLKCLRFWNLFVILNILKSCIWCKFCGRGEFLNKKEKLKRYRIYKIEDNIFIINIKWFFNWCKNHKILFFKIISNTKICYRR